MRMTRRALLATTLAAAVGLAACGGRTPVGPSAASTGPQGPVIPTITPGRVAIISIDGLRPDALFQAGAPNIMQLANRGSYTWQAQTISPSNTLPSHISMLTGYTPDAHGVTWDDYAPTRGQILVPTLFGVARAKGLRTTMVVGKEKFATFRDTGTCDTWILDAHGDDDVATMVGSQVMTRPDLIFVHLADVDLTGHATQWMSEAYLTGVRKADQAVGRIVAALPADTTIILTADHGGHVGNHGTSDRVDMTIPWIIAGPATAKGHQLSTTVRTVDTAATAAFVLGTKLSPDAAGQPIYEAFGRF